jgi:hypothetical protein
MKIANSIILAAIVCSCLGSIAAAEPSTKIPLVFGPAITMQYDGHSMQVQAIKTKDGGEFIVISKDDAAKLFGQKAMEKFEYSEMTGH